jgi:hypothetical protein
LGQLFVLLDKSDYYQIKSAVDTALAVDPVQWDYQDSTPLGTHCCLCGDDLERGTPGDFSLDGVTRLPIHSECHNSREGLSSQSLRICLIGYKSLLRKGRCDESGIRSFLVAFATRMQDRIPTSLIGHGVEGYKRGTMFDDHDSLIRWIRHTYVEERERPKFQFLNISLPAWNESEMKWSDFVENVFKPTYRDYQIAVKGGALERRGFTKKEKQAALKRTSKKCSICSDTIFPKSGAFALNVDHIKPHALGGLNCPSNLQPTHQYCNKSKSSISGGQAPMAYLLGRFALIFIQESTSAAEIKSLFTPSACESILKMIRNPTQLD